MKRVRLVDVKKIVGVEPVQIDDVVPLCELEAHGLGRVRSGGSFDGMALYLGSQPCDEFVPNLAIDEAGAYIVYFTRKS